MTVAAGGIVTFARMPVACPLKVLVVGVGDATGVGVGVTVPHRTSINAAWNRLAARKVKLTGSAGLIGVNLTTTEPNVPDTNAGMVTTALTTEPGTTVSDRKPVPAFT
jgi:hypothetical protein